MLFFSILTESYDCPEVKTDVFKRRPKIFVGNGENAKDLSILQEEQAFTLKNDRELMDHQVMDQVMVDFPNERNVLSQDVPDQVEKQ